MKTWHPLLFRQPAREIVFETSKKQNLEGSSTPKKWEKSIGDVESEKFPQKDENLAPFAL